VVVAAVIGVTVLLAIVLLIGWLTLGMSGPDPRDAPLTARARLAPFDHIVLEQGEVESSENVEVLCEVKSRNSDGTAIIDVIAEGTEVKKGDWLVTLDSSALEEEQKTQKIAVNVARAKLITSKALQEQATIARVEYEDGTFLQEEQLIESEILVAEEKLSRARETAKFSQRLAAMGFQTAQQLKADLFAVDQAQVELDLAKSRLKTLKEITKTKMMIGFNSDIEAATAQVEADQNSLDEEEAKLHEIEDQIAKCNVTAPADGQVVYANIMSRRGNAEFVVEPGAFVRERQAIINLPNPQKMQVKATVNESRITLVEVGDDVDISIGAFAEGRKLNGSVYKVNKYAEPSSWFSSQVKEYACFVEIKDPPPDLRTGMTAEVRIFVDQQSEALQIPVQAVYEHKGHTFCIVRTGPEQWETRKIEIGSTNDKTVTVLQSRESMDASESVVPAQMAWGLKADEEVVLNPRQHLDLLSIPADLPKSEPKKDGPVASRDANERSPLLKRPVSLEAEKGSATGRDS
jgi:multidrug resistance efflux pump